MSSFLDTTLPAEWRSSENYQQRKDNRKPDILLMHYTGMENARWAINRLCDVEAGVSCHYLIDEMGNITQMVREEHRAWHAGKSYWHGETDINSSSIGIEIANKGHNKGYPDFPTVQMDAVIALSKDILTRWDIPSHRIIGHSDVAPRRKQDPGEKFDWQRLSKEGLGHWIAAEPIGDDKGLDIGDEGTAVKEAQTLLRDYGYNQGASGRYSQTTKYIVTAFQRHFRQQKVDGIMDLSTLNTLKKLHNSLSALQV